MLNSYKNKYQYRDFKLSDLGERLARLQRIAQAKGIGAIIIIDGWESSGRGTIIKELTEGLNPKHFKVKVFDRDRSFYPYMGRFWQNIPTYGDLTIFNRSYYFDLFNDLTIDEKLLEERLFAIKSFEQTLYNDHLLILKFFIDVDQATQTERIHAFTDTDYQSFYVDTFDQDQNENYDDYRKHMNNILERTSYPYLNWHIIDSSKVKNAAREVLGRTIEGFQKAIERVAIRREDGIRLFRDYQETEYTLENLDLSPTLSRKKYDALKEDLQEEAYKTILKLRNKGIYTTLVFEGMDAAGKDGAIERLIKKMDPRVYTVHAISAPDQTELAHNYLWRFYNRFTQRPHLDIFSRSWYGRVMVERIEGFATENEWERAYDEMTEMEKHLVDCNSLVLKFFVMIDKETQLERFAAREKDVDKQYKITNEDWRNRNRWDDYVEAMNEMLVRTNKDYAPWIIIEGNDKQHARIKVIKEFIKHGKQKLAEIE
ncbi:MAG: hypothetical protein GX326_01695 [Clostridiaceae bacterium]|nr:hypothetical protein [Clostridiaceae bacterium]